MKKRVIILLFSVLGFSAVCLAQNYVTGYVDCNYSGTSQMFKIGRYSLANTRIGSQNISSIRIPAGFKVVLYTSAEPGDGEKIRLFSDTYCLSTSRWNDKALSMVVEKEGQVSNLPDVRPVENNNLVTLFQDCNFRGSNQSLSAGYHDYRGLGIGNDVTSSIRVPSGWSITVYQNSNYSGRSATYSGDISCLSRDWNDQISSVLISRTNYNNGNNNNNNNSNNTNNATIVSLYEDGNFQGRSVSLSGGNYSDLSRVGFSIKGLSSLVIPSGWKVVLYEEPGFRGSSYTLLRSRASLSLNRWNDRASSMIIYTYGGIN